MSKREAADARHPPGKKTRSLKKKTQPLKRATRRIWGYGLLTLLILAALLWFRTPWAERLQAYGFDSLQILAPRKIESLPVTIVAIDDKSIAALGQWPWPRTDLAELVRAVARQQPAAIGALLSAVRADRGWAAE